MRYPYPPGKIFHISYLGERKIIDSKVPWEGICDRSQEGIHQYTIPRRKNMYIYSPKGPCGSHFYAF